MSSKPKNYYTECKKSKCHNPHYNTHKIELPFRAIIVGASGSGKSLCLLHLISQMPDTFEELIICCRSRDEPLYDLLSEKAKGMVTFYENTVPPLDEFKKEKKSRLIAFDDLVMSKKLNDVIAEYYLRSRKINMSCVYLTQSWYQVPKFIRLNTTYIILKKISSLRDLKMIIKEFALSMDIDDLLQLYKGIVSDGVTDFLMIDLVNPKLRYRHNLEPLEVKDELI